MPDENQPVEGVEEAAGFKPITSQDELNRIIGQRIEKVKSQFADYPDLKAKAEKFDEVQESTKSELQKAQEAAQAAEARAQQFERAAVRARIAAELDVPVEVLSGDDEESLRASAQKVIEWRDSNKKAAPKPSSLKSGASGSSEQLTGKEKAAAALRQMRGGS